jgi:hypothetical protein
MVELRDITRSPHPLAVQAHTDVIPDKNIASETDIIGKV